MTKGKCIVPGCDNVQFQCEFCSKHYTRLYRNGTLALVGKKPPDTPKICTVSGCGRLNMPGDSLCDMHRMRLRRHGDPGGAERLRTPSGVGNVTKHGYVRIGKKRKFQHRAIMEALIGRVLYDHETVHHRNGNRDDNRPENLELWSTKQPKGQRIEDKVSYAREILSLYGSEDEQSTVSSYLRGLLAC